MTTDFKYFNVNPNNRVINDCVCRAISGATNQDYYSVEKQLLDNSYENNCDTLCVDCYEHLLEDVYNLKRHNANGLTVGEIASLYNKAIIRIHGHLTFCENGKVNDIWDCSNEIADIFWVI